MRKSSIVLTSYDYKKIIMTASIIIKNVGRFNIVVDKPARNLSDTMLRNQPKIWGCEDDEIKRKIIMLTGNVEDLKKLIKMQTPDGVNLELFPNEK